jgi:hydrogenase expression/formation protein HypD
MKYIDEFRDPQHAKALVRRISRLADGHELTFMEVCGTHTMALGRFGIRAMLPESIRLISGPGCPVCVTDNAYLDRAIALARTPGSIVATFGDMMRVPASTSDLTRCRAEGNDIRVVISTTEALAIARDNPDREVIFLGVGFETTTPTIAASIAMAHDEGLNNFSVLCAHKLIPPALEALLAGPVKLDGFLLPGHVSSIIGGDAYEPLLSKHRVAATVAGFEPTDILQAIADMVEQAASETYEVHISYTRVVSTRGNEKALALIHEVFEPCDAAWRGIGTIPGSGLRIRDCYAAFDAERKFRIEAEPTREHEGCRCGEILQGTAKPADCPHFGKGCTPENPIGACMVSSEGTCAAYYRYG